MRDRIKILCIGLIALCGYSSWSVACNSKDRIRPLDRVAREVDGALQKREFAKLDGMANEYKTQRSFSSDGQPKLMGFYAGTSKATANCQDEDVSDKEWQAHQLLLQQWSKTFPDSVPAKLSLARFEIVYAWYARGGGYASSVTEEGWRLFRQRIATSRAMLEKMQSVGRDDPEWYAAMLSIALAQGWERVQFDALYEQATQKFPHYLAYYFTKGSFYSAKWHGSQSDFKAFVEESVRSTEKGMGQTMYARLNWSAQESRMFINGKTDWARMKVGFETMIKDYPDAWNLNNFAKFACMAGDWKTFLAQFEQIKGRLSPSAWGSADHANACEHQAKVSLGIERIPGVRYSDAR